MRTLKPVLVIVDPISAALADVNQNDGATVRRFLRALAQDAVDGGWGVLMIGHSAKSARFMPDPGSSVVAGSSQWVDAMRGALFMTRYDGGVAIECVKANHGPTGWAVTLDADMRGPGGDVFAGWKTRDQFDPDMWAVNRKKQ